MDIVLYNQKKYVKKTTSPIYNAFFSDLYDLMNSLVFKKFYKKHFANWDDINTTLLYFKVYETLDYLFYYKYKRKITKNEMIHSLNHIFKNYNLRSIAVKKYEIYKKSSEKYLNFTNMVEN